MGINAGAELAHKNSAMIKMITSEQTFDTAVMSHIACCGYARKTLAMIVMRTVKTWLLE